MADCDFQKMGAQGKLIESWQSRLEPTLQGETMQNLRSFLLQRKNEGAVILPPSVTWFAALNAVPFEDVKVVIIGQDPYHGVGQAHGLCFSVNPGVRVPPSLINIYKELQREYGMEMPAHGNLTSWAEQGVLLLNAVLTVEEGTPGAHANQGWEQFTDEIIRQLNADRRDIVFMLWGAYAQRKAAMIDSTKHCILRAPHPSPLSAHRGFIGCGHFEKANRYLMSRGVKPIDWRVPTTV